MLRDIRHRQLEQRLKTGSAWNNPNDFVFTNALSEPLKHETVRVHFKKAVTRVGLPELRFHDLRHSFAVISLQVGDDIKTIQENLSHYSASFTLDTYAHVTESMRKESSKRMDLFINTL